MKKIKIILITFIITITSSCDDFGDLNIDPNSVDKAPPATLLSTAQYRFYNLISGVNLNAEWGLLMVQQWAQDEFTEESRYIANPTGYNATWSQFYAGILNELDNARNIINEQDTPNSEIAIKNNQLAIITTMEVQVYHILVDTFGAVPYSETNNIFDNPLPSYDTEELIYKDILKRLKDAIESYNTSESSFSSGDLIFNGNISSWKSYSSSLLLKLAMRISDVDSGLASSYIQFASTNLITEDVLFTFSDVLSRSNPLHRNNNPTDGNRDDYRISKTFTDALEALNDPRLDKYAEPAVGGNIIGMPYGLTDINAFALKASTSSPAKTTREATTPHVILSYSEVQFLLAEAYQRGFLAGNSTTAYNQAITSSMNYWGITDATAINNYLTANPYNATNWKESIGTQKWISLYMNGLEAWSEWRRLDFPVLTVPADAAISTTPVKLTYPNDEISNNGDNLKAVAPTPTKLDIKIWWDIN